MGTSPMMVSRELATPSSQGSAKEVRLHTDIMTKEVEKVVEKIVTVEVPGPERIVEVERVVIKEVRAPCLGDRATFCYLSFFILSRALVVLLLWRRLRE